MRTDKPGVGALPSWTTLTDPGRQAVEELVRRAPRTEWLELKYETVLSRDQHERIAGMIEAARPLPLRGLRLVNLYGSYANDGEIRDYFDTAPAICDVTDAVLPQVVAAKWLELHTFEIVHADDGMTETKGMAKARFFAGLRRLAIESCDVPERLRVPEARDLLIAYTSLWLTPEHALEIVKSAPKLERLAIDCAGREIIAALKKSSFLPGLSELHLRNIGDDAAVALAALDRSFARLDLLWNQIGAKGAAALAASPAIAACGELDLRGNDIPEAAAARLREHLGDRVRLGPR